MIDCSRKIFEERKESIQVFRIALVAEVFPLGVENTGCLFARGKVPLFAASTFGVPTFEELSFDNGMTWCSIITGNTFVDFVFSSRSVDNESF